jgi:hypothetical protein
MTGREVLALLAAADALPASVRLKYGALDREAFERAADVMDALGGPESITTVGDGMEGSWELVTLDADENVSAYGPKGVRAFAAPVQPSHAEVAHQGGRL